MLKRLFNFLARHGECGHTMDVVKNDSEYEKLKGKIKSAGSVYYISKDEVDFLVNHYFGKLIFRSKDLDIGMKLMDIKYSRKPFIYEGVTLKPKWPRYHY